jgi:DHA1 family inner membrane transport protein
MVERTEQTTVSVVALVAVGVVQVTGALILNAMPAIVGGLTRSGRLDSSMAGYLVGIDLASQVVGTILFLRHGRRFPWHVTLSFGIVLMALGNALSCLGSATIALFAARLVAGTGAGVVRAACLVAFARARDPARAIAGLNAAQVVSQGVAFATFPWLTSSVGWFGPYLALSIVALGTLATAFWWPKLEQSRPTGRSSFAFGWSGTWCLVAVFMYFIAQSAIWAFAEAIGTGANQSTAHVTYALECATLAGIAATPVVFALSSRLRVGQALVAGLAITLVGLYLLTVNAGFGPYALGISLFNFAWCVTTPFEFAIAAVADEQGNTAAAFSASDGLGLAAGPAIAGVLISEHRALTLNLLAALLTMLSIALFAFASRLHQRSVRA